MCYYIGAIDFSPTDELRHFGILGMKWGIRRYQNKDGTLTTEGMERYRKIKKALDASKKEDKAYEKIYDNPAELKKMSDAYANNLSDDKRKFMFDRDSYKEHGNTFKDWYYDNFGQDSDDSQYKPEELRIASKEFIEAAKDFIGQKEWSQKALSTFQKEMSVASGLDDDYYLYDSQKRIVKKEFKKYFGMDYDVVKNMLETDRYNEWHGEVEKLREKIHKQVGDINTFEAKGANLKKAFKEADKLRAKTEARNLTGGDWIREWSIVTDKTDDILAKAIAKDLGMTPSQETLELIKTAMYPEYVS